MPDVTCPNPKSARLVRAASWPLALLLVVHATLVTAINGTPTDDFTTVYSAIRRSLAGTAVYEQAYNHVDPLYLYNPGTTLLLTPLGLSGSFDATRTAFIVANSAAIVGSLALLTRLFGHRLSGAVLPVAISAAFATESVTNTLAFTNINGILLLLLSGWLYLFVRECTDQDEDRNSRTTRTLGRTARPWLAGLLLGVAITIKPQFAPLLALPLVRGNWRIIAGALAVPVALNALAWPLVPGASGYLDKLVPYLSTTRDYANSSLAGLRVYFDLPGMTYYPTWLLLAGLTLLGLIVLLRWRVTKPLLWAATTTSLILAGVFLLSSLGQQYYSMWLFPLCFTVLLPRSVMHTWPAWASMVLIFSPLSWTSERWPDAGRWLNTFGATAGWALLIITITGTALGWWRLERETRA